MAGGYARVEGVESTLRELNAEIGKVKSRSMAGLMAGGLVVQRQAQQWVPVEHGFLHGSAYTRKDRGGALAVDVGFDNAYAFFVHENMEQTLRGQPRPSGLGFYWGPDGRPKFLEAALVEKSSVVLDAVASYARIR